MSHICKYVCRKIPGIGIARSKEFALVFLIDIAKFPSPNAVPIYILTINV